MKDEKGFILPITLLIVFLLSSFVTFQINQYYIEKELLNEQTEVYLAERLLQIAVLDINKMITQSYDGPSSGKFSYDNGEVTFVIKDETNEVKSITLVSKTLTNRSRQFNYFYYLNNETVLPWLVVK